MADIENEALQYHQPIKPHKLDQQAEAVFPPAVPPLVKEHAKLTHDPYLLQINVKLLAYVDVFVENFLGLAQGPQHRRRHVRRTLFHALDKVFRPLGRQDAKQRKEVLSLKKLDAGDCSWSTCQILLRWIVDSINTTITLPPQQLERLRAIFPAIPGSQQRIGVDKWHRILSEMRSMALALPGSKGLFSQLQEALCHVKGKRVTLFKGVHEAFAYFLWIAEDLSKRPARICELVPIRPTLDGYNKASGYMCIGVVLQGPTTIPWVLPPQSSAVRPSPNPTAAHTVVWRELFPKYVVESLVSWTNPQGIVNNSGS